MHRWGLPACLMVALLGACTVAGADGLTAAQAAQHVGEKATVCGVVAGTHYASDSEGQPTFINLDKPYPDQLFTIVVWGDYRRRFPQPPETLHGHLCVTGTIRSYHGEPEIDVTDPSQITR